MHTIDPKTKKALCLFLAKIAENYNVSKALLFGSRARHTHHHESDADVAILLKGLPGEFITTKFALDDIAFDVLLETGIRIQPLPIWQEEWEHPEKYSNPYLLENINREGIPIT